MAPATAGGSQKHSPLSPRQQFQSRIRNLDANAAQKGHRRNHSISLQYNPYHLRHVSSLRVRSNAPPSTSPSPVRSGVTALQNLREEPDFVLEERKAWSRRSPGTCPQWSVQRDPTTFEVYDEGLSEHEVHRSRQRLQPFFSLPEQPNIEQRPKTRRGCKQPNLSASRRSLPVTNSPQTRSKFLEGSMTSRSQAVASTWVEHHPEFETSTTDAEDNDLTPKASTDQRSSSIDLQDFEPPSTTKSAVRRTLFRRKSSSYHSTLEPAKRPKRKESAPGHEESEKKGRKRLRRSLSSWSLHGIGEKFGLFHDSTDEADACDLERHAGVQPKSNATKSLLDDRKRKAETAYAEQFGTRKHKGNSRCEPPDLVQDDRHSSAANSTSHIGAKDIDATIRARQSTQAHRGSLQNLHSSKIFQKDAQDSYDTRKRPTRRELEKENQHLREMLKQSQVDTRDAASMARQTKKSKLTSVSSMQLPICESISHTREAAINQKRTSTHVPCSTAHDASAGKHPAVDKSGAHQLSPGIALSPNMSVPDLTRSVTVIMEESEDEADGAVALTKPVPLANDRSKGIHRRHSMHGVAPCQVIKSSGHPEGHRNRPFRQSLGVLKQTSPHRMLDSNPCWQGWDDDVF